MSENTTLVWIVGLWIVAAFLFAGTPDMTDVLIAKLAGECPMTKVETTDE